MDYQQIITIEPDKRSGKPCIRGMQITVTNVLEYLAGGLIFSTEACSTVVHLRLFGCG